MELINTRDLINELKKRNLNLGKGDPYNRLRYYTKIGWIDHMIRKKDSNGVVVGHYPYSVIEKIIEIEEFKKSGKTNDEISTLLKEKNSKNKFSLDYNFIELIKKKFNINIILLIFIMFGFIFELYNYNSLNDKIVLNKEPLDTNQQENKITEKGKNIFQSGKKKIFINSKKINDKSAIIITFEGNIEPATHYYISEKINGEGFTIETNLPIGRDSSFNWIVIN